jgi:hypothetical protein
MTEEKLRVYPNPDFKWAVKARIRSRDLYGVMRQIRSQPGRFLRVVRTRRAVAVPQDGHRPQLGV